MHMVTRSLHSEWRCLIWKIETFSFEDLNVYLSNLIENLPLVNWLGQDLVWSVAYVLHIIRWELRCQQRFLHHLHITAAWQTTKPVFLFVNKQVAAERKNKKQLHPIAAPAVHMRTCRMPRRCSFIPLIITAKQVSPLFSVCGKRDEPLVFHFVYPAPVIALDVFLFFAYFFMAAAATAAACLRKPAKRLPVMVCDR